MHLEKRSSEKNLNMFFLVLYVLFYLGKVRCEMLELSYSMVDRVLLFLGFDIPKIYIVFIYCCVIEFTEISKGYFFPKIVISPFIIFLLYLCQC